MDKIIRIALIGPESSGKTSLCRDLAAHYKTVWVPEFAREYVTAIGRKYTVDDIEYCYKEQLKQEKNLLASANQYIFTDTELIIAKVWSEDVFKRVTEWIEENIETLKYDLYLLTYYDLPWQQDPVRENPHRREYFFDWYKRELEERRFRFSVIRGTGEERCINAIAAIEKMVIR